MTFQKGKGVIIIKEKGVRVKIKGAIIRAESGIIFHTALKRGAHQRWKGSLLRRDMQSMQSIRRSVYVRPETLCHHNCLLAGPVYRHTRVSNARLLTRWTHKIQFIRFFMINSIWYWFYVHVCMLLNIVHAVSFKAVKVYIEIAPPCAQLILQSNSENMRLIRGQNCPNSRGSGDLVFRFSEAMMKRGIKVSLWHELCILRNIVW